MHRFSVNGDGKDRAPTNRISSKDGQSPAQCNKLKDEREDRIIKALKERYDEIEALWNEAEEDLKRFRSPFAVEHCYDSDYDHGNPTHYSLWWTRYGKGWRIVFEERIAHSELGSGYPDESREWKPVIECPLELRLHLIDKFPRLREKVIEAAESAVPGLEEAISSFRKILKG
jgi:hypothetical protein